MSQSTIIIVVVAVVSMFIGVGVLFATLDRMRRSRLERTAAALGLEATSNAVPREPLDRLPLFWYGTRRRIRNVMRGRIEDLDVLIFDHQYLCGYGTITLDDADTSRIHCQTVALIQMRDAELPDFELRPSSDFRKRARVRKGYKSIEFPGPGEFVANYLVRGPDSDRVRGALTIELLEFLCNSDGLSIDAGGAWLAVYRLRRRVKPDDLHELLKWALDVCGLLS